MKISQKARNAIFLGTLCSVSYLAVYIARNILGAVTPQMIAENFDELYIAKISSTYFIFYAVGQLINGAIGDRIKAKYMISAGLLFAGISNFVFSQIAHVPNAAIFAYAMTGFFLSMIYGPMTKVVSESTELKYATRCSLGYTFASFFGSPMAGVLATFLTWQATFAVSSAALVAMSVLCFSFFIVFEKFGIVKYPQRKSKTNDKEASTPTGGIKSLIEHKIIKFALISIITGVIRTSVVFWLPTYFYQYLGFSEQISSTIFTVATLIISFTAFVAVFTYERLGKNMHICVFLFFAIASVCFSALYFIKYPIVNIVLIILGIMASNSAASVLWSIYCPSLRETGLVSSATGFLDFLSYMAAAAANLIFASAVTTIGWGNLILVWLGLMLFGIAICVPDIIKKRKPEK